MRHGIINGFRLMSVLVLAGCVWLGITITAAANSHEREATVEEVRTFFREQDKQVLTFIGYSGAGYEDPKEMIAQAEATLRAYDPAKTLVNIGATPDGIGAVYALAKRLGFVTTGVVSSVAREHQVKLSPHVDHVFYIKDTTWGGFQPGTETLSPTSQAMVENSEALVAIGGGEVGRDELMAARRLSKPLRFIAADMNYRKALAKARKKGQPAPTDLRGAAHAVFGPKASRP